MGRQVGKVGISEGAGGWEELGKGVGAGQKEKSVRTLGLAQSLPSTVGFLPGRLGQEGIGWPLNFRNDILLC